MSTTRESLPALDFEATISGWLETVPDAGGLVVTPPASHPARGVQSTTLTAQSHAWMSGLNPRYQPWATARRHPHIVNRLSALWETPEELPGYLRELLLVDRPHRQGFSFEVLTELTDLQTLIDLAVSRAQ